MILQQQPQVTQRALQPYEIRVFAVGLRLEPHNDTLQHLVYDSVREDEGFTTLARALHLRGCIVFFFFFTSLHGALVLVYIRVIIMIRIRVSRCWCCTGTGFHSCAMAVPTNTRGGCSCSSG